MHTKMKSSLMLVVVISVLCHSSIGSSINTISSNDIECLAKSYLDDYNRQASEKFFQFTLADWKYSTNITEDNLKLKSTAEDEYSKFIKDFGVNFTAKFKNHWQHFRNSDLRRQSMMIITGIGAAALPEHELKEYNDLKDKMTTIYNTIKMCSFCDKEKCNLSLEPDVVNIMKKSSNEEELRHLWTEWHNKCGNNKMKTYYQRFAELTKRSAMVNGFNDTAVYWFKDYESDTFMNDVEDLLLKIKPLYQQIHAYVRTKLSKNYPDQFTINDGLIPAHLLGNMWALQWDNIYSLAVPYPEKVSLDITEEMKKQNYTVLKMVKIAEEFFTSLGLLPMPKEFWDESLIEKPQGRELACHPTAWDFNNGKDFRILMCATIKMEDFVTIHHEMGHIQYFMQYKDKPILYRNSANPGFHEAIGDIMDLSVQTPKHLKEIGLLDKDTPIDDNEMTINFLFRMALQKIVILSHSYIVDKYRWKIFNGSIKPSQYNSEWWKLRKEYQGIKPPTSRSEDHFDAGVLFHVPAHYDCIRYFVSFIIQFQFHRALCQEAGQYDINDPLKKPLHKCDIYKSHKAGSKLASSMKLGASHPWPEVMKNLTGQEKMDVSAMIEYFKPLEDWLKKENEKLNVTVGCW